MKIWNFMQGNERMQKTAVIVSKASQPAFFVFYAVTGIYLLFLDFSKIWLYVLIPLVLISVSTILRKSLKRPRPHIKLGITPFIKGRGEYSCPSNHASGAMVISAACMYVSFPFGAFLSVLAIFTGLSRVAAGAHYPLDIVFGWGLGVVFGLLFLII